MFGGCSRISAANMLIIPADLVYHGLDAFVYRCRIPGAHGPVPAVVRWCNIYIMCMLESPTRESSSMHLSECAFNKLQDQIG